MTDSHLRYSFGSLAAEFDRAIAKHGWAQTPLNPDMSDTEAFIILVEEIGEVATAMTYDRGNKDDLKKELLQVAAMAYARYLSLDWVSRSADSQH